MGFYGVSELDDLELTGERLALRRWRRDDADRLESIMSDRSMHEFLARPNPFDRDDAIRFVTDTAHAGRADGTGFTSAIVERATGRLVGAGGLRLDGDGEIGCWIAPDARGHGYAAEVARTLAGWGFAHGLARAEIGCDVRNLAAARSALAAGFQYEGISRNAITSDGRDGIASRRGDVARFARLADDPDGPIRPRFARLPDGGLTDGVLALRVTEPGDAVGLLETDDETSLRWGFTGEPHSLDHAQRVTAQAGLVWLVGAVAQMTMIDVASGGYAGELHLRTPGPPGVGGIGYVVHPRFRGRGFTTRALNLMVAWAFGPGPDFARLELGAKTANIASQRAALNAGFEPDGVRRTRLRAPDGTFSDENQFALLNPRHATPSTDVTAR